MRRGRLDTWQLTGVVSGSPQLSMKVLFLGPTHSLIFPFLNSVENEVVAEMEPLDPHRLKDNCYDFLVSCGYRHILRKPVLDLFQNRAINLHIALLPWNRGADPNLWSFVERTPKGVTIHYLDEGVDTGDIIAQREIAFRDGETLRTTYDKLHNELRDLFVEYWPRIRLGQCPRTKQEGKGTLHRVKDKIPLAHMLTDGWDTPVSVVEMLPNRAG
jgi:methionyl-tRNA formyltransferase